MLPRLEFEPDIQKKFDHLLTHLSQKNQATYGLVKILKDICNLESFYSNSLNKFAAAICELLKGKDPIKQILITLEQIIASKVTQSQTLANQIKNDIIPHFEKSINVTAQMQLRSKQTQVRSIRDSMQKKIRILFLNQTNFRKSVSDTNSAPKLMVPSEKQRLLQNMRNKSDQFSQAIDSYNSSLNDYMLKYSQICEMMIGIQTNRKNDFRDATIKLILHQLQAKRSFQYDITSKSDKLGKMESKLMIQDKGLDSGLPFYEVQDSQVLHLGKIQRNNYINSIIGKKKLSQGVLNQQIKISQIKQQYKPGQISKTSYHQLVKTLYPILTFIHKNHHINLLIEVVLFSKELYIQNYSLKLNLLNSLQTHEMFGDEKFWQGYEKKLMEKIGKEEFLGKADLKNVKKNVFNVLERDLLLLTCCQINPYVTTVIKNIATKTNQPSPPNPTQSPKKAQSRQPIFI